MQWRARVGPPRRYASTADFSGSTVGFIRLLVSRVSVTDFNRLDYDVTWQFWAGAPVADGGAQDRTSTISSVRESAPGTDHGLTRREQLQCHDFLRYAIVPATFRATMNGEPIGGFTPVAGTREPFPFRYGPAAMRF